jgi:multicomponent Na+:H+ antiporter subunit E
MNYFLLNLILALTWAALTGGFTPINFLVGFGLGFLALQAANLPLGRTDYFHKVPRTLALVAFFLAELFLANLRVAADVLTPRWRFRPRVVAIPLEAKSDIEITLLSNLVSLTPGSISLDVSSDRSVLYIHAMYAEDADQVRRQVKDGFEKRLLGIVRGADEEADT